MRLAIILSVIFNSVVAQTGDTLLRRIQALQSDTEKVNQLYKAGFSLRNSDPQTAFYYAHVCEEKAQISESKKHLAKSYNLLGILFYKKGDFRKALAYHKKALTLRIECNDDAGIALSETNLGNIYTDLKAFEKAEESYLKALEIFNKTGDNKRAADCMINLGVLKQNLKQYDAAFGNYSSALKLAEKINDYEMRSLCLNNIAQVYFDKGDYERSVAFNEDALKIRNLMDNNVEVADSYLNLASNYIKLKQPEKAKRLLDTAFNISRRYNYFEAQQLAFRIYSDYFSEMKNYELAYAWLKKYELSKDSILAEQNAHSEFNFNMPEVTEQYVYEAEEHLNNLWLLISVFIFMIFVPLFLIRFKR
jgi:tetratricopeptide (TPR) repeat protein